MRTELLLNDMADGNRRKTLRRLASWTGTDSERAEFVEVHMGALRDMAVELEYLIKKFEGV